MIKKYGFVYIWYDKFRKMYYIGSHWGTEDDGYICSSIRMNKNYLNRPNDFKRRIIERVFSNRDDLYLKEYNWLKRINKSKLGKKYYNVILETKPLFTNKDKKHTDETKLKMSISAKNRPSMSEETKNKIREARKRQVFSKESMLKKSESLKNNYASKTLEERRQRTQSARNWCEEEENKKFLSEFRSEMAKKLYKEGKLGRRNHVNTILDK